MIMAGYSIHVMFRDCVMCRVDLSGVDVYYGSGLAIR